MLIKISEHTLPDNYHHPMSMSSLKRSMKCPASVKAANNIEQKTNERAKFGTLVHEYVLKIHNNEIIEQIEGFSPDAYNAALKYIEEINKLFEDADIVLMEKRVFLESITTRLFDPLSGTVDSAALRLFDRLIVVDLKTGFVDVPVKDNPQLLGYTLGIWDAMSDFAKTSINRIDIVIIQINNRVGCEIKTHTITVEKLLEFRKELQEAVVRVEDFPDLFIAGEHCHSTYCPVALNCKAAREYVADGVGVDLHDLQPGDLLPAPTDFSRAMNILPAVKSWCKLVEQQSLEAALDNPESMPDFQVNASFGHRKWVNERLVIFAAKAKGLYDKCVEVKLKSPAQLEKIDKDLVGEGTTFRPSNGYKLVKKKENDLDEVDKFLKGESNEF